MSTLPFVADPHQSLQRARLDFFDHAGFGPSGGYDEPWAEADFGSFRYRVPNGAARARALQVHDLHHVVTGYATDWRGESEISAWELGSGGPGPQPYAWVISLWGLFVGLLTMPERVFRAFVRGRGSRNLYRARLDGSLLGQRVAQVQRSLAVQPAQAAGESPWAPGTPRRLRMGDRLAFAGWTVAAMAWGLTGGLGVLALVAAAGGRRLHGLFGCPLRCQGTAAA